MRKTKKGFFSNKNKAKKAKAKAPVQDDDFEEDDMGLYDDENQDFFEEEFVPPEGEDLDEVDDTLGDLYAEGELDELENTNIGDKDEEGEEDDMGEFNEDEEDEDMGGRVEEEIEVQQRIIIDNKRFNQVIKQVNKNSRQAFRMFLKIFRGIVMQGLSDDLPPSKKKMISYEVESGSVYNKVIKFALTQAPHILKEYIENGGLKPGSTTTLQKKTLILCNVYFANFLKLLQKTHDKNILAYILTNSILIIKIISFIPVYLRKFVQLLIGFWSSHESNLVKFKAFVNIKTICEQVKDINIESIYRKMYLTFIKGVKQVNWFKFEQVRFMMNCYVELLGLNKDIAYMVGFSYIRTIAIHLKTCMNERTKENIFKIYNWQFLNSIRLWFAAIGAYPDKNDLGRLAHPLIEITFGILKFYPQVKYAPFRLHLIEYMNDFSRRSSLFIPLSSTLLQMLSETNFNKKRDRSSYKKFDFTINIRVQKHILNSESFYEQLFKKIIHELVDTYSNLTSYLSFPESIITTRLFLRKLLKEIRAPEMKVELKRLIQLLEENTKDLKAARDRMGLEKNPWEVSSFTKTYEHKILRNLNINKMSMKIKQDAEEYIKQNILSEQDRFYAGDQEEEEDQDGENQGGLTIEDEAD